MGARTQHDGSLRDIDCLVGDALQIHTDAHASQDETQIPGHRLLQGQKPEGQFIDLHIQTVDLDIPVLNLFGEVQILLDIGPDGLAHRFFGQGRHLQHLEFQCLDFFMQMRIHISHPYKISCNPAGPHQPNRPVM